MVPYGRRDMGNFSTTERDGHLFVITINRPEVMNALHPPGNAELSECFDEFAADPDLWVAISPQPVDELVEIKRAHDLPFRVAHDADNALARSLGLTFRPDAPMGPPGGTSFEELPHPSFVVVGRDGTVQWLSITPDWMAWTEASDVLAAVHRLLAPA